MREAAQPQSRMALRCMLLRKSRGLLLRQVAEAMGVSEPMVSRWEVGKSPVNPLRIAALAELLGVTEHELLFGGVTTDALIAADYRVREEQARQREEWERERARIRAERRAKVAVPKTRAELKAEREQAAREYARKARLASLPCISCGTIFGVTNGVCARCADAADRD